MKLDHEDAERTVRRYVCSDCFGHLVGVNDRASGKTDVRCTTEGCPCNGFVRKSTVELRRVEGAAEEREVRQVLTEAGLLPAPAPKSEKQILSELGF